MNGGMAVLVVHRRVSPELAYLPWAGRCNLFVHVWSAGGRGVAGRNQGDIDFRQIGLGYSMVAPLNASGFRPEALIKVFAAPDWEQHDRATGFSLLHNPATSQRGHSGTYLR